VGYAALGCNRVRTVQGSDFISSNNCMVSSWRRLFRNDKSQAGSEAQAIGAFITNSDHVVANRRGVSTDECPKIFFGVHSFRFFFQFAPTNLFDELQAPAFVH
jgi:hypothetical protein